jgi:hypothetical protein
VDNVADPLLERWRQSQDDLVLQSNDLALSTLANMVASGTIDIAPRFQRRDRWNTLKQSTLIESFLLNLPVPPIYLTEQSGGIYSVIDGRQRLTAIRLFFEDSFSLGRLEELPELEGYKFSDLPQELRSALSMRPLRSVTLMRQTNTELKYIVFRRLNSAGEVLNAQEIRNVVFRGPLNDEVYNLAEDPFLRKQLKIESDESSAYRKMQDVEFVLRYLVLAENWEKFSGDLAPSMDRYMAQRHEIGRSGLLELRQDFIRSIRACEKLWGDHAFQRPDKDGWRAQALAGLYDAEMVAVSLLSDAELNELFRRSEEVVEMTRALFADSEFEGAVRTGTNTPARIKLRIDLVVKGLRAVLGR